MLGGDAKAVSNNLDVIFVIDNTISMLAEDYEKNQTRLSAVKEDCNYIINKLSGGKFSVITFNDESHVVIPLVKDANMAKEAIQTIITPDALYAKGSTLNTPLDDMLEMLKKSNEKTDRKTVVFFISDGEITNNEKLESFSKAKKYINDGAVLGYGTKEGGYMKIKEKYTEEEKYLEDVTQDYPYPKAVSKIDEDNLKNIAKDMGIEYINMKKQSNINNKLNQINKGLKEEMEDEKNKKGFEDIYYIFVVPLFILLIWEFIDYKRKMR